MKYVAVITLCLACAGVAGCAPTSSGYGYAPPIGGNTHPSSQWLQYCYSDSYAQCGRDGAKHHHDGNQNN